MVKMYYSDRFVPRLPRHHRFPIQKYQLIREQLLYEGAIEDHQLIEAEPCEVTSILKVHHADYWEALSQLTLSAKEERRLGFPQSAELIERSKRSVGGTIQAAYAAIKYGIGMNIAGGTHHAFPDRGEGFCLLNDIAIAIEVLFADKLIKRPLIVDLDVHQGNGNAAIFTNRHHVYTFSMHAKDNYPLHKETSNLDIELPSYIEDTYYLSLLKNNLPRIIDLHQPDIIFYQAGVDVLASDTLGKLNMSKNGCKHRDNFVFQTCKNYDIPVAACIGGGYSKRLTDTVDAHSNTFRAAMEVYG